MTDYTQILVDKHWAVAGDVHRGLNIIVKLGLAVDDLHRSATKHERWTQQHRIADARGHGGGFIASVGDPVIGLLEAQFVHKTSKTFAVFGVVDRVGACPKDRNPRVFKRLCQFQRGLAAKLDDDSNEFAG